jgi:hypothetical protein
MTEALAARHRNDPLTEEQRRLVVNAALSVSLQAFDLMRAGMVPPHIAAFICAAQEEILRAMGATTADMQAMARASAEDCRP